jgi:hypothetical protein
MEPQTISLPHQWAKAKVKEREIDSQVKKLVDLLTERPTVMFASPLDKSLGIVGLTVDEKKIEVVSRWLQEKGIAFEVVGDRTIDPESRKGVVALYLSTASISEGDYQSLVRKFKEPLNLEGYSLYLNSLPNRPESLRKEVNSHCDSGVAVVARPTVEAKVRVTVNPLEPPLWERNLLQQAFESLGDRQQATFGKSHTVRFEPQQQILTLVNNSSGEVVYQADRGAAAKVDNLTPEQKEYFAAPVVRADVRLVAERSGTKREMEMEY